MVQCNKELRGKSSSDTTAVLSEVNFEFAKTQNKIIFDKHIKETGTTELIAGPLTLPKAKEHGPTQEYGMVIIPPHNFPEAFSNFCFNTTLNKNQSILAQQEIRRECNDVLLKDIFNPNLTKSLRCNEFNQIQKSSIGQISYYLKESWINKIKDIIKRNFEEDTAQAQWVGHPWYSLTEPTKDSFETSKLKKFLMQTRFVMEDTLLQMTQDSVKRFVKSICEFVPLNTEVLNSNEVVNTFYTPEEIKKIGAPKPKMPLFHIDLTVGLNEQGIKSPQYSTSAKEVVQNILGIFDSGIKSLQEI